MALVIRGLRKAYGSLVALDGIDLTLEGGVVALLGANGSGKSTLLRILATMTRADSGDVAFDGWSYALHERQLRAQIGYLPQTLEFPEMLTPRKLLNHLARLRGAALDPDTLLRVEAFLDQPFHRLSGGQQRMVGIVQAFLGAPRLLLLDEFVRGLDMTERESAFRLIGQRGALLIFSTHIPAEIESLGARQVIVLDRGRILFYGTVEALRAAAAGFVYEIRVPKEQVAAISASRLVSRITPNGSHVRMRVIAEPDSADAVAITPTLEDAYLWLTRRSVRP